MSNSLLQAAQPAALQGMELIHVVRIPTTAVQGSVKKAIPIPKASALPLQERSFNFCPLGEKEE
jgi:hypothetical protein